MQQDERVQKDIVIFEGHRERQAVENAGRKHLACIGYARIEYKGATAYSCA